MSQRDLLDELEREIEAYQGDYPKKPIWEAFDKLKSAALFPPVQCFIGKRLRPAGQFQVAPRHGASRKGVSKSLVNPSDTVEVEGMKYHSDAKGENVWSVSLKGYMGWFNPEDFMVVEESNPDA